MTDAWLIRNAELINENKRLHADVRVRDGRIAAIGRDLIMTAGVDALLTIVALVYWGDDSVQSALTVSVLLISVAGVILAIARGLIAARALGKAKPTEMVEGQRGEHLSGH